MNPVEKKFEEIYDDLEANVVQIPKRRDLMWFVDMCFHSVLAFEFQGRTLRKGVVEGLILGDTRTGKTHTLEHLIRHYQHGDLITGESVSLAGLLGGVDEANRRRFVRCGRLPMSHRQFVAIDEANEMSKDLIGKMSGVRSAGVYQVEKIASMRIPCKVRMVWIANTRSQKAVSDYSYGVEAVLDLIGKPEDVARFDMCIMFSKRDVDRDALRVKSSDRVKVPHRFTSDLCAQLVRWAWSRRSDQILIDDKTEERILYWAERMSGEFDEEIPLVIETEQRNKIARLAVATACRVFSHDGTGENVLVLPDHVDAACRAVCRMYRSETMGYDAWTRSKRTGDLGDDVEKVLQALGAQGMTTLLNMDSLREKDLRDILGGKEEGSKAYSILLLNKAIEKRHGSWRLTSAMIDRLKDSKSTGNYGMAPNPNHLRVGTSDEPAQWQGMDLY